MTTTSRSRSLLALTLSLPSIVTSLRSFVDQPDQLSHALESDENLWISLDESTEYLHVDGDAARRLGSNSVSPYATQAFVDGGIEYDEIQQAWRYLGFMIDCDSSNDDDGNSGSGDGGTGEGCARYIVWAAYVDLEYEGGGIGEYQYYDTNKGAWDTSSCNFATDANGNGNGNGNSGDGDDGNSGGRSRCAKMDCHKKNTHFSLLGIFKHKDYNDWMGQLFKHEGYCVWTSKEYRFMKSAQDAWPEECAMSETYTTDGGPIYYDLKPTSGGGMTIGLYTDTRCVEEYRPYRNDPITVEYVVGNVFEGGGSGDSQDYYYDDDAEDYDTLEKGLAAWDSGFEKWRVCQPCVAYDITNVGYNTDDDASKGDGYWMYNPRYDDDAYQGDDNGGGDYYGDFDCYDKAGYTNVNQCMKFMAKTTMNAATYRDLSLAMQQGNLDFELTALTGRGGSGWAAVGQSTGVRSFLTIVFFMCSSVLLYFGVFYFKKAKRVTNFKAKISLKEPLVFT